MSQCRSLALAGDDDRDRPDRSPGHAAGRMRRRCPTCGAGRWTSRQSRASAPARPASVRSRPGRGRRAKAARRKRKRAARTTAPTANGSAGRTWYRAVASSGPRISVTALVEASRLADLGDPAGRRARPRRSLPERTRAPAGPRRADHRVARRVSDARGGAGRPARRGLLSEHPRRTGALPGRHREHDRRPRAGALAEHPHGDAGPTAAAGRGHGGAERGRTPHRRRRAAARRGGGARRPRRVAGGHDRPAPPVRAAAGLGRAGARRPARTATRCAR